MFYETLINLDKIFNNSFGLGIGTSFLAGVLASFSPCIYPMIPITLGIIGAVASSSKLKGFLVSLVFVLGIAFIYCTLGAVSSLFGTLMGTFMINPVTYLFLASVFVFLGLSELDIVKVKMPFFSVNYTPKKSTGLLAIFILGVISGLAMIPCNFPVLFSILNLIALKKNIVYGVVALFAFSLGYGLILIVLGTFTSLIRKLPKNKSWIIMVKKIIGFLLLGVGGYFLYNLIEIVR